jgi:hypothetical protein
MSPKKAKSSTSAAIPAHTRQAVLTALAAFSAWPLDVNFRGRYCYIDHAGEPLCRLGFRGGRDIWDFHIYRYTRGTYGSMDLGPDQAGVAECVRPRWEPTSCYD